MPPVHRAFEDAKWSPDDRNSYCGRCGGSTGLGEANESGCGTCRNKTASTDGVVRLGRYSEELREWIVQVKYAQWAAMGQALGRRLGNAVLECNLVEQDSTVVVPMPMPWQRRLYRGIDHARVIAAAVAQRLCAPMVSCLMKNNGPPMVSLTATERAALGGRGMRIRPRWGGWPLEGLDVVIVDDVRTTGASIRGAVRLLRSMNARSVIAALVAVAEDEDRRTVRAPSVSVTADGAPIAGP